ncbi:hypothetical protein MKS87_11740 [Bacillus subtilis]|uniref:hypothetical protein n=1 Tax=Bacillus TaxID=1386 RepID=UPI00081C8ED1|nr:hypothetical protein [Bacillus subtilis]AOA54393.1 hypothetical protein BSHJ0_01821 [Bacillus subtilis]MCM3008532.1 hypothetical protein [Bacillus subtilis]MDK8206173.1 hypothetical protein [Bacillus subtilis]MDR4182195.1 hypothetical protein [Bacillus subtilis]MEC1806802.1 hypothetical protein [Bacillus subtilis]
MSLISKLTSKKQKDKEFKNILASIEPLKEDYYTLSGNLPFSKEYSTYVPYALENQYDSSLVGVAFDYLARFRIGQFTNKEEARDHLIAYKGLRKLSNKTKNYSLTDTFYIPLINDILDFIRSESKISPDICQIALKLAKLEQLYRSRTIGETNVDFYTCIDSSDEIVNDLISLLEVFENKFINSGILTKNSEVVFNPSFGISSPLVGGADADIWIDGTLYDFKTTKKNSLDKNDNLQLIGYFILNELAQEVHAAIGAPPLLDIDRLGFYKARYGEIEFYDIEKLITKEMRDQTLVELAKYFSKNPGKLNLVHDPFFVEDAKEVLKSISARGI